MRPDRRTIALVGGWTAVVLVYWFGLFVRSMRPDADGAIAIDLDGYFFPKYVWGVTALRDGWPLWNPYEFAGFPFLGAGQPAALSPIRIALFGLLPAGIAMHAFMLVHYLLLGAGSWLALRVFGLGRVGAAVGTAIVCFQPTLMNGHYHPARVSSFAWVPLVLASFVRTLERGRLAPALALAGALVCEVLAGYPEYLVDVAVVLIVLWIAAALHAAVARDLARFARGTAYAALGGALAVAIAAPAWVAVLEATSQSVRASGPVPYMFGMVFDRSRFGAGLAGWVVAMSQLAYVPPLGWAAAPVALATPRVRWRWTMLLLAALAVAATTTFRNLPPFSFFRSPFAWYTLVHVFGGFLAGAGVERLLGTDDRPRSRIGLAWVALAALPLAALCTLRAWIGLLVAVATIAVAPRRWAAPLVCATVVVAAWTALPLDATPHLAHHFAGGQPPYPTVAEGQRRGDAVRAACGDRGGRVVAPAETWQGVPLLAALPVAQGYPDSLASERMSRLLDAAGLVSHDVLPVDWVRVGGSGGALRALDVRCLLAPAERAAALAPAGFSARATLDDGRVAYVRDGAGAWIVGSADVVADGDAALHAVTRADFDPARRVVLERPDAATGGAPGTVVALPRTPTHLPFAADAPGGGELVVAEHWYPGWQATVDGAPVAVRRANYTFIGVPLPPGRHSVALDYRPRGFTAAVAASAFALAITLLLVAFAR